ncbi:MAG: hypothetical protein R3E89_03885 [Thiolinea sp.]
MVATVSGWPMRQQQLLAAGFEVFRDVIGLKPGDVWYHKLELSWKAVM